MSTIDRARLRRVLLLPLVLAVALGACGSGSGGGTTGEAGADGAAQAGGALTGTVRLGYFPNVTHAPALVGIAEKTFARALGDGASLKSFTFDSGTEAAEAILAGSVDISFIGPNPAINAFATSNGEAIRIIAGSTSGGAFLVVKPSITTVDQLRGTKLATPSLGNTQDVALRAYLSANGLRTDPHGGGDVSILPQKPATALGAFTTGAIDGAWVPEPWATRLVNEGGGSVLVDERDLWPETGGQFVTTHVIVRTAFLEQHRELVKAVLNGLIDAIDLIAADPAAAQADVITQISSITGTTPNAATIAASFANLTFTLDPIAASLRQSADDAVAVGLLEPVSLDGIYDLALLNEILRGRGLQEVRA